MNKITISNSEEEKIYQIISDSLLSLCGEKPNNPINFLSQKMSDLNGDDISKLVVRKKKNQRI